MWKVKKLIDSFIPIKIYYRRFTCLIFSFMDFLLCFLILVAFGNVEEILAKIVAFVFFLYCFYKWLFYFVAFFYSKPGIIFERDRLIINIPLQHFELYYNEISSVNSFDFYYQTGHASFVKIGLKNPLQFFEKQTLATKFFFKINDIFHGTYIYLPFLAFQQDPQFFKSKLIPFLHNTSQHEQKD